MSGFVVDPATLNNMATVLQNLGSDLDTIHDARGQLHDAVVVNESSIGSFSSSGFDDAGNALENFAGGWSNGIAQLNRESGDLATVLTNAATAYSDTEQKLAGAIAPGGSPGTPGPVVHGHSRTT